MKLKKLSKKKNKIIIPYGRQFIDKLDVQSVVKVLNSRLITQGSKLPDFEKSLSKKVNSNFAVAVNSATSALHIACLALGLKKNEIVWTTAISFVATSNCAIYCGAKVEFLDIELDYYNLDLNNLEKKLLITKKKNLPKIIIITHLAGQPLNMEKLYKLSKKYKFKILEDASHALGAKFKNNKIGDCKFSDICVFSFHPVKSITTGEGGAALTNNKLYAERMKLLRNHGIEKEKKGLIFKNNGDWYYEQKEIGFNYRMSDLQAALGISQLKKLDTFIKKRNYIANIYFKILKDLPIVLPKKNNNSISSFHLFIIRLKKDNKNYYKKIFSYLRSNGLLVNLHYLPIYSHPFYKNVVNKKSICPNAELYSRTAISLPIYPKLKINEVLQVKNILTSCFKKFN